LSDENNCSHGGRFKGQVKKGSRGLVAIHRDVREQTLTYNGRGSRPRGGGGGGDTSVGLLAEKVIGQITVNERKKKACEKPFVPAGGGHIE